MTTLHMSALAREKICERDPGMAILMLFIKHRDIDRETGESFKGVHSSETTIYYDKTLFPKNSLNMQATLIAKHILHISFRHISRGKRMRRVTENFSQELWSICCNAVITQIQQASQNTERTGYLNVQELLKKFDIKVESDKALTDWSVERLYRELHQFLDPNNNSAVPDTLKDVEGKDDLLFDESYNEFSEDDPNSEEEMDRVWLDRIGKAQAGSGSNGALRQITGDLPKPKTNWKAKTRGLLTTNLEQSIDESDDRPSNTYLSLIGYYPDLPFESGVSFENNRPRIVFMVDTSGSIDKELLKQFVAEMIRVKKIYNASLIVIVCDDRVHGEFVINSEEDERKIIELEFKGHGGTEFTPALKAAEKYKPTIGVYLTDLCGATHHRPKWPVLWAVPKEYENMPHPFGHKVVLEL